MATELPSLFSAGAEPRGRDPYSNYANPSDAGFGFGHDFGSASTSGGGGAGGGGIATLKSPFSPDRAHGAHGAYHDEVGTAGLRQRGGGGGIPPRPGGTPGDGLSSSALRSTQMSTGNAAPPTLSLLDSGAGGGGMLGGGAHTPTAHGTMTNGMMDLTTPPGTTPRRGAWGGGSVHGSGAPADYASTPRSALRHGGVGDGEVLAFNGTPRHPPHGGRVDDDERLVSTVGHAHGHAHAVNAHGRDERWKSWVLVFGFQAGGHAAATRRFQQVGRAGGRCACARAARARVDPSGVGSRKPERCFPFLREALREASPGRLFETERVVWGCV